MNTVSLPSAAARAAAALSIGVILLGAQPLAAQSCLGLPSLNESGSGVSTIADGTGSNRTVVGRVSVSTPGMFTGVRAGYSGFGFAAPKRAIGGGDIGVVRTLGASGTTTVCPVLQVGTRIGPLGHGRNGSDFSSSLSLALGHAMRMNDAWALTPYAQVGAARGTGSNGRYMTVGTLGAGFGLRMHSLTITPSYSRPVRAGSGVTGVDETYSLSITWSSLRKR